MKRVYIVKSRYVDSVTLMGVAERISKREAVAGCECGMGTAANIEMLTQMGYEIPDGAGKNDLMIAVDASGEAQLEAAYQAGLGLLNRGGGRARAVRDLADLAPGQYDIAQISLPGEYAAAEIRKAIERDMDVFVFSDNVSLEDERALKELARGKGRLVMGPDAGVGLIGGVALAAGSIVRPGGVGIVGASGSGAQEVACLIERLGAGVSAIIGTGGRDLRPEIGGITMRMGIDRLEADADTKVICLVSKLADPGVMAQVLDYAETAKKPVVAVFLGGGEELFAGRRVRGALSLQEAAELCYSLLTGRQKHLGWTEGELDALSEKLLARIPSGRKYFRGLYCGGTFTEEALILFARENPGVKLMSNLSTGYAEKLPSHRESRGHAILDLGAEDFTAEAPHPVFDPALRLKRLDAEMKDPQTAVVLIDFITGPGLHPDPIEPFARAIAGRGDMVFIATICGAQGDPQDIGRGRDALEKAGAVVADSNHQSARLAARLMAALDRRG
jgi:FdrA protein